MSYYLVFVHDDIDPEIIGPFASKGIRDDKAIDLREEFGKNHGIFKLETHNYKKPTIETYSSKFFASLPEECW